MSTTARLSALALAATLAACGSTPPPATQQSAAAPAPTGQTAATNEPAAADDAGAEQPSSEDLAAAASPPIEAPEQAAPVEVEQPAPRAADRPRPAELGRPDWWFNGVQRSERTLRICAEAGGPTVREARRAAIDAARRRLALETDADPISETVSLATVLPLPAADAGPGSAKYIGYVLMEVPAP